MNAEITDCNKNNLEESIVETRDVLIESLQGCDLIDINAFISHRALARPPFSFIQSLVKLYITTRSFAQGLYTDEELETNPTISRQDKVRLE